MGITNVLSSYQVKGGQVQIADPKDRAVWEYLCTILRLEARQKITQFNLFSDGYSNILAYTSPVEENGVTDNSRFCISIDYYDVYDENGARRDWSKLTYTILHEYGHVLLEDETQEPDKTIPAYLREFIADFKEEHLRYDVSPENVLSWMYYDYMMKADNQLVKRYAEFSMNLKNLVTALNARKYGMEVAKEVIGSNEFAVALRTSNAKDFGLTLDYPYVGKVIALMDNDLSLIHISEPTRH